MAETASSGTLSCPLQLVRTTTSFVTASMANVRIDEAAVKREAEFLAPKLRGPRKWETSDMHFNDGTGLTAQYILVLDAMNFCFWPDPDLEYEPLARAVKAVACKTPEALSAASLKSLRPSDVRAWFGKDLPMMDERVRLLREVGEGLEAGYGGSAENLIKAANKSASTLVRLMLAAFPGFRDACIYKGRQIFMYKRVQIFVGDVWGAFKGEGLGEFTDIGSLTTFPDYRVPQLLRVLGVMEYAADLGDRIDHGIEIAPCSEEEIEIRAATVQAVESLRRALKELGVDKTSVEIDWELWQRGEEQRDSLLPHHRTLTIFY